MNTYYFNVGLYWNSIGTITIEANSLEEAREIARNIIAAQITFQGLSDEPRHHHDIPTRFPITASNHMKTLLENFINGNLTDARTQAKKYSSNVLFRYFHLENGYTIIKAHLLAKYLKTGKGFQDVCNCK